MKRIVTVKHALLARPTVAAVALYFRLRLGKGAFEEREKQVKKMPSPKRSILRESVEENFGLLAPHCAASWLRSAAGTTHDVQRGSFDPKQEVLVNATQRLTTWRGSEDELLGSGEYSRQRCEGSGSVQRSQDRTTQLLKRILLYRTCPGISIPFLVPIWFFSRLRRLDLAAFKCRSSFAPGSRHRL